MPAEAAVTEPKGQQPVVQHPARRRPAQAEPDGEVAVRYFLAGKAMDGGPPTLGREMASENEALIESLKTGINFYAVSEYRATPDLSGKSPLIRKEAVRKAEELRVTSDEQAVSNQLSAFSKQAIADL